VVAEFYASEADLGYERVDPLLLRSRLPSSAVAASIWWKWNRQIQLAGAVRDGTRIAVRT
jgi:hypothetical protein